MRGQHRSRLGERRAAGDHVVDQHQERSRGQLDRRRRQPHEGFRVRAPPGRGQPGRVAHPPPAPSAAGPAPATREAAPQLGHRPAGQLADGVPPAAAPGRRPNWAPAPAAPARAAPALTTAATASASAVPRGRTSSVPVTRSSNALTAGSHGAAAAHRPRPSAGSPTGTAGVWRAGDRPAAPRSPSTGSGRAPRTLRRCGAPRDRRAPREHPHASVQRVASQQAGR